MHLPQRGATDDLGIWLMDKPEGLEGAIIYNADIYRRETGAAFKERYLELLRLVAQQPDATLEADRRRRPVRPARSTCSAWRPTTTPAPQRRADRGRAAAAAAGAAAARAGAAGADLGQRAEHRRQRHPRQRQLLRPGRRLAARDARDPAGRTGDGLPRRAAPLRVRKPGAAGLGRAGHRARRDGRGSGARPESRRGGLLGRVFSGWGRKS